MLSCTAITNLDVKLKFDLGKNNNNWFIDSISTKSVFSSVVVLDLLESVAKCPVYFCHSVNHILYIHQDLKVCIWGFGDSKMFLKIIGKHSNSYSYLPSDLNFLIILYLTPFSMCFQFF